VEALARHGYDTAPAAAEGLALTAAAASDQQCFWCLLFLGYMQEQQITGGKKEDDNQCITRLG